MFYPCILYNRYFDIVFLRQSEQNHVLLSSFKKLIVFATLNFNETTLAKVREIRGEIHKFRIFRTLSKLFKDYTTLG